MSALKRFFVNKIDPVTELSGEEFEHAKNVLRLSAGDEVILLDNSGKEYTAVIAQVDAFAEPFQKEHGSRLFFCADEFYLKAKKPLPKEEHYEGYPQLDNGVGMLRSLWEEMQIAIKYSPYKPLKKPRTVSIATGMAAKDMMESIAKLCMESAPKLTVSVYPIENNFFGKNITVSGLLTGKDIIEQLKGKPLGDCLLIPQNALRAGEQVLLDDLTVSDIQKALCTKTVPAGEDGMELYAAILGKKCK